MLEDRRPNFKTWELISMDRAKCLRCGWMIKQNMAKKMALHDYHEHQDMGGIDSYNELHRLTSKANRITIPEVRVEKPKDRPAYKIVPMEDIRI